MRQHGRRGQTRAPHRERRDGERADRRERLLRELPPTQHLGRSSLTRGSVVWASMSAADGAPVSRARPGVVVGMAGRHVHLLPLTSSHQEVVRESPLYVRLEDWARAGLRCPCRVARQAVAVDVMDVSVCVGSLSATDLARVLPDQAVSS